MSDGIWYPSKNHRGGWCDVDVAWFPPKHLEKLLEQFNQQDPETKTIHIPEDVKFETENAYHHYIFKGGVPFHGMISKEIMKSITSTLILHKRKVE